tara:strand:+ start:4151 stop:4780 length:630 start_codon:yes stop_codon:yes gene_type:complete
MDKYRKDLEIIIKKNNLCISRNPHGIDRLWPKSYIILFYNNLFNIFYKKNKSPKILEINQENKNNIKVWEIFFEEGIIDNYDLDYLINNQNSFNYEYDFIIISNPKIIYRLNYIFEILNLLKNNGLLIIENIGREGKLVMNIYNSLFYNYIVELHDYRLNSFVNKNTLLTIKKSKYIFTLFKKFKSLFSLINFFIIECLINFLKFFKNI